ncbi:MAG: hypothetical protein BWX80_03694 [Candidatus Hydrogenedentes bacterium ADurb.Bin101]|nr:MAG: hypothetical protein BWX80_03694 [Candidatus Hydrogenedentes bacterium ADurb.Bin101]
MPGIGLKHAACAVVIHGIKFVAKILEPGRLAIAPLKSIVNRVEIGASLKNGVEGPRFIFFDWPKGGLRHHLAEAVPGCQDAADAPGLGKTPCRIKLALFGPEIMGRPGISPQFPRARAGSAGFCAGGNVERPGMGLVAAPYTVLFNQVPVGLVQGFRGEGFIMAEQVGKAWMVADAQQRVLNAGNGQGLVR